MTKKLASTYSAALATAFLLLAACSHQAELAGTEGLENQTEQAALEQAVGGEQNPTQAPPQAEIVAAIHDVQEPTTAEVDSMEAKIEENVTVAQAPTAAQVDGEANQMLVASNTVTEETASTSQRPVTQVKKSKPPVSSVAITVAAAKAEPEKKGEAVPVIAPAAVPAPAVIAKAESIPKLDMPKVDAEEEMHPMPPQPAQASAGIQGLVEQYPLALAVLLVAMVGLTVAIARHRKNRSFEI